MSPRTGRPPIQEVSRKESLNIRLTEEEKRKIEYCSEKLNLSRTDTIMKGIDMIMAELKIGIVSRSKLQSLLTHQRGIPLINLIISQRRPLFKKNLQKIKPFGEKEVNHEKSDWLYSLCCICGT